MICEVGAAAGGAGAGVVGAWVGWSLATVLGTVLKLGLLAVVNLAAVVGCSKGRVVRGFSVSTWMRAGRSVWGWTGSTEIGWMERLGCTGCTSTGSGLTWGLEGRPPPLLGLNLLEVELGPSTMACRAGGAGRAFSLSVSRSVSLGSCVILVGVLGMLLVFLTLSPPDLDLSIALALTGSTSSP